MYHCHSLLSDLKKYLKSNYVTRGGYRIFQKGGGVGRGGGGGGGGASGPIRKAEGGWGWGCAVRFRPDGLHYLCDDRCHFI